MCSLLLHRMEKRKSRGHLLEQLESSGTKTMMRGPIVRHRGKTRETKTKKIWKINFMVFYGFN